MRKSFCFSISHVETGLGNTNVLCVSVCDMNVFPSSPNRACCQLCRQTETELSLLEVVEEKGEWGKNVIACSERLLCMTVKL